MKLFKIGTLALIGMLLFTACSSVRVISDYDETASFSSYKTFAFHDKGIEKLKLNDLDKRRIVNGITAELVAKGMQQADAASADVVINVLASSRENIDVNYYNDPYYGWYYYPWMDRGYVNQYTEGTLLVDMIDRQKNVLVWQGKGIGFRVDDLKNKAEELQKAITAIMAKYPPQAKK